MMFIVYVIIYIYIYIIHNLHYAYCNIPDLFSTIYKYIYIIATNRVIFHLYIYIERE